MVDTLLFDLDGTLVPFAQADFNEAYFRGIVEYTASLGYDGKQIVRGLWAGIYAMLDNDGSRLNRDVFWDGFAAAAGDRVRELEPGLDSFYAHQFNAVRAVLQSERELAGFMERLREKGYTLVLATNPVFPAVAVDSRMGWVGLRRSHFDYVTTYENSGLCKPGAAYYRDILAKIGKAPEQCLMVGNNPGDDGSAREAGLAVHIVTDYLENEKNVPLEEFRHSSFARLREELLALPDITD